LETRRRNTVAKALEHKIFRQRRVDKEKKTRSNRLDVDKELDS
jgi:hypothetical protein